MKKYLVNIGLSSLIATGVFLYLYFSETSQLPNLIENLDLFLNRQIKRFEAGESGE